MGLVLLLGGCHACEPPRPPTQDEAKASLSLKQLSKYQRFSFRSKLSLSLVSAVKQQVFQEELSLDGVDGLFHFIKKIDPAHYFEIIGDASSYAVKNRQGPWRSGRDNRAFLNDIIDDGLNLNQWFMEQCGLSLAKHIDTVLKPDAPFIQAMPPELGLHDCKLRAKLDKQDGEIELTCQAKKGYLALSAQSKLLINNNLSAIVMPKLADSEPLLYPVNIAPKLLDLLKKESR